MRREFNMVKDFTAEEIIQYISEAEKVTPLKVYVNGQFENVEFPESFKVFGSESSKTIFCDANDWTSFYENNKSSFTDVEIEHDRRNSAIPLIDDASSAQARHTLWASTYPPVSYTSSHVQGR